MFTIRKLPFRYSLNIAKSIFVESWLLVACHFAFRNIKRSQVLPSWIDQSSEASLLTSTGTAFLSELRVYIHSVIASSFNYMQLLLFLMVTVVYFLLSFKLVLSIIHALLYFTWKWYAKKFKNKKSLHQSFYSSVYSFINLNNIILSNFKHTYIKHSYMYVVFQILFSVKYRKI